MTPEALAIALKDLAEFWWVHTDSREDAVQVTEAVDLPTRIVPIGGGHWRVEVLPAEAQMREVKER